ncbi:MAG: DUF2341 domain-containing protein [Planctomycetota bacterium]|nr:DUF2341 domain-containing protein [Planctomycetota bacterium]
MKSGFTLLEVLLSLAVLGVLSITVATLFIVSLNAHDEALDRAEMLNDLGVGFERLRTELTGAKKLLETAPAALTFSTKAGIIVGTERGVYLLENGKNEWLKINGIPPNNIPDGVRIRTLICEDDGRIFAGGDDGKVYRSADLGMKWSGSAVGAAYEVLSLLRASNGRLYAGTSPGAVYVSNDDGATWLPTGALAGAPNKVYSLLESNGVLYAGTDWTEGKNLYRSTDGGLIWTPLSVCYVPPGIWFYRRPVTITNTTSTPLTNYQVCLKVDYVAGKMRSDYGDLRFRSSDGVTELPYWLEYYDAAKAIVWVKVPSIPANGSTTIYMYYGNPAVATASSITSTMEPAYIKNVLASGRWERRISTTPYSGTTGDDVGAWVDFLFTFPYWRDAPKTRAYACSNGFLIFDPTPQTNDPTDSLAELIARCMVAPFWDDLRTDTVGSPAPPEITRNPGLYVDSYADRIMFDWEVTRRGAATRQIKFQAILFRNGDIAINIDGSRNITLFSPTLGISLGNGTSYIDITGERPTSDGDYGVASKSWLFTIRKYVSPEPSGSFGAEQVLYNPTTHIYSLDVSATGGLFCAGTGPNGYVFLSADGLTWKRAGATFAATEVYSVRVEEKNRILAGASPGARMYLSNDEGASWSLLQQMTASNEVRSFRSDSFSRMLCAVSDVAAVGRASSFGEIFSMLPSPPSKLCFDIQIAYKQVRYFWGGVGVQLTRTERGMEENLGGRLLSNFSFEYVDTNFKVFLPASQSERDRVRFVRVSYTETKGAKLFNFSTTVRLRGR